MSNIETFNVLRNNGEVPVFISPVLPVAETRVASDIKTKEQVYLSTGKEVHCMVVGKCVHISKWYWENILLPDFKDRRWMIIKKY